MPNGGVISTSAQPALAEFSLSVAPTPNNAHPKIATARIQPQSCLIRERFTFAKSKIQAFNANPFARCAFVLCLPLSFFHLVSYRLLSANLLIKAKLKKDHLNGAISGAISK